MVGSGYSRSNYDSCVYFCMTNNGSFIYLLFYAYDMLIAAKNMLNIVELKEFKMKDLGAVKKIHGMELKKDRKSGKVYLTQNSYIETFWERFGMKNAKPVSTPLAAHLISSTFQIVSFFIIKVKEKRYMTRVPTSQPQCSS